MTPLRIIVGGMVGQFPLGGVAWDYLHYVLALHELGHDVVYHEDTWVWPYDPVRGYPTDDPDYTVRFLRNFFERHAPELRDRWHYVLLHERHFGMDEAAFDAFARSADLFLNVSGACFIPDRLAPRCVKAWMDTDPGYNHIRLATRPAWAEHIDRWIDQVRAHDRHLTYAENICADDCRLPRLDFDWIPTRPVATLAHWSHLRDQPPKPDAPLTTVMSWDYFPGKLVLDGVEYHGKPPEYERFRTLPTHTTARLALAVGGHKTPTEQIRADGFELRDARQLTLTPESYQDFIASSAGEWSVAKNVFVALRTGWFSTRTACYLAAGRPAVVQDTAWSRYIPSGSGVHAFSTLDEAVAAIDRVLSRPEEQRRAACDVAEQYLSPKAVLPPMLARLGLG